MTRLTMTVALLLAALAAGPAWSQDQGPAQTQDQAQSQTQDQTQAQDQGKTQPQDQAPAQPQDQAGAPTDWYLNKPIQSFAFKGLQTVKDADLQAVVKSYIGKPFTVDPLLWEIEAKLYALDYFETIVPNALPANDARSAVIIEFDVKERPQVVSVDVTGNATVRANEITDKILLKKGDLANQTRLLSDVEAVKSLYLDKGYTDVQVSAAFQPADRDNTVRAVFTVVEGLPTTIKEVRFSGNQFASENTLRGLMKTKAQFLFDSGVFQEAKLEEDEAAIIAYYNDRGFVDAKIDKVSRDLQSEAGHNYLVLTIYVTEGEQWLYGGMQFVGNQVFPTSRLAELVYQKPGKTVSLQKLQADISRVQDLYSQNGYVFNTFNRTESRNAGTKTISYTLTITEYDKAHIESIIFKGNTRTKDYVLRRELPFEEGEVFNQQKIIDGYRNLVNLQYFKSVQPTTPTGSEFGLINVVFNVEEASTADINFGVVFSGGNFPISGTIKWNERNFQGRGETVGVDLEASPIKQTVALNFVEPWLLGRRWSVGTSLSFDHETTQNVLQDFLAPVFTDSQQAIAAPDPYPTREAYLADLANGVTIPAQYLMSYDAYNIGLGLNSGYIFTFPFGRLGLRGGYNPDLRYVDYDPLQYRPFEASVRDNNKRWSFIDQLSFGVYLDGRDIFWNPTTGYYLSQNIGFTGGILLGDRDFIRTDTTAEGFLTLFNVPVFENWNLQLVLAAHTSLSFILPQFTFPSLTWQTITDQTDQVYIDGMNVGRGWGLMYGNALWNNKLELRMPIVKEALWLVGFLDAAGLWDEPWKQGPGDLSTAFNTMSLDQFYFSVGAGIRFSIPQFPIRLYLAKGFQIKPNANPPVVWKPGDLNIGGLTLGFVISLGGDVF